VVWDLRSESVDAVVDELAPLTGGGPGLSLRRQRYLLGAHRGEQVQADVGHPEVVVNNAGVVSGARLLDLNEETIRRTFEVNALAPFW